MADEKKSYDEIVKKAKRLYLDDQFTFRCGQDLDCFTHCCSDVAIVLTPYDVLRMKRALKMDSSEFLEKYTILPFTKDQKVPVVLLNMSGEGKRCPFASANGCAVYANRPWACRMYPLGVAEPKNPNPEDKRFYFLLKEDICHGHEKGRAMTVREWIENQGIEEYDMMGASFKDLMLHDFWEKGETLTPRKMEMYHMALFDIDRFRRFVFESSFLEKFIVDEARVEAMREDDEELLDFAAQWLRFSLFGDKTMKMKPEVVEGHKAAGEAGTAPSGG